MPHPLPLTGERTLTTSALMTFVALNKDGGRVTVPPLEMETEEERVAFREAEERRAQRIARRKEAQAWLRVMPGE